MTAGAAAADLKKARDILRGTFGHENFLGEQERVIAETLAGRDVLAVMPTGGGKSLCYQIPAILRAGAGVVVSPLIALMKDQVDALAQNEVRAAYWNSSLTQKKADEVCARFANGELDLFYVAPERLLSDFCLQMLRKNPPSLFAIDEAHCISQWGHDFRPDYLHLGKLAAEFPGVPRLALTATADARTREDIAEKLKMKQAREIVASFDRPNISYEIRPKRGAREQLMQFYREKHEGESGIVYCLTRRGAEETAERLEKEGVRALPYHAGMDSKTRADYQEKFKREEGIVIAATVAFGMGIDKPDVRFVAHINMPKNIESYYQETGRAGRDGLASEAVLFYGMDDVRALRKWISESRAPETVKKAERKKLDDFLLLCESTQCRRAQILAHFGEEYSAPCGNCDNCLNPPQMREATVAAQKFLSCVARACRGGRNFNAAHIADILLGKETERVNQFGHEKLSTFGIGGELRKAEWLALARRLISGGKMEADEERFGGLKLTAAAKPVLRGEETIAMRERAAPAKGEKAERKPSAQKYKLQEPLTAEESARFELLRAERSRLAQAQNVPPYVIFHDTTLLAMAREPPADEADFAQLPGVGAVKAKRYARPFLRVLRKTN